MKDTEHLELLLRSMFLTSFARNFQDFALRAEKQKIGHIAYLHDLARTESQERQSKRIERLVRKARLLPGKSLENFELSRQPSLPAGRVKELATGEFLERCENILIFGVPGAGKSHFSSALGRQWCLHGRRVLFMTAAMLVQDLLIAKRDLRLQEFIKQLDRYEALIID